MRLIDFLHKLTQKPEVIIEHAATVTSPSVLLQLVKPTDRWEFMCRLIVSAAVQALSWGIKTGGLSEDTSLSRPN